MCCRTELHTLTICGKIIVEDNRFDSSHKPKNKTLKWAYCAFSHAALQSAQDTANLKTLSDLSFHHISLSLIPQKIAKHMTDVFFLLDFMDAKRFL